MSRNINDLLMNAMMDIDFSSNYSSTSQTKAKKPFEDINELKNVVGGENQSLLDLF